MNKILLHLEGLAILTISTYFYFYLQFSWLMFIILLFAPDLSALGYLKNNKVGSIVYNLFHTYTIPVAIIIFSLLIQSHIILMISLIWVAHIGMDRLFGYGLKFPEKFQDTHLNRI
ncbi:DUF4260 domain-containing protein [Pseudogracilibacillus sp. SO30301A]|uniref:DUF4260 domain-containing protein n=1 Tax=Pseudogracilibacillus sp. SO30301A TaxID=3098291 RepID=UPI00300E5ABE